MKKSLFLILILISGSYVYAQQSDCKVLLSEIAGSYSGDCRKGLAHGNGIAQGEDRYEGHFSRGLPNGKGIYTWSYGDYYEGQWKKGIREGAGKMVSKDSTITGFWKSDKYIGERPFSPYKITRSMSVSRSSFSKRMVKANEINIKIYQAGTYNRTVSNLTTNYSNGAAYSTGDLGGMGVQNVTFPIDVKIKYTTLNKIESTQYDVIFEFTITDPGSWEVIIHN
jgi:hypothetical protein